MRVALGAWPSRFATEVFVLGKNVAEAARNGGKSGWYTVACCSGDVLCVVDPRGAVRASFTAD